MKILMTHSTLAGTFRLLCAAFVWLFFCVPAWAGEIQWEKLPDRERLTMRFGVTEGMAGTVGRIDLTGLVVPFTRIPSGLLVGKPPEGATLFKSTRIMGTALVIETQTPEFGFVVPSQTPTELVIDFFPNPLGARWRPTTTAPTTEVAPELVVRPLEQPDAATRALATDPQGIQPETAAALNPSSSLLVTPPAPQAPAPALVVPPPAPVGEAVPAPTPAFVPPTPDPALAPAPAPVAPPPVFAPGGEAAPVALPVSPAPVMPPPAVPQATVFPDNTAIPLPPPQAQPGQPPVAVSLSGTPEHAVAVTQMAEAPSVEVPARPLQPPMPSLPMPPAEAPAPPVSGAVPPQAPGASAPASGVGIGMPQAAFDAPPPISGAGIGMPVAPGVYTGTINTGGLEDIAAGGAATPGVTPPGVAPPGMPATPPPPISTAPAPAGQGVAVPATATQAAAPQANETVVVYTDADGKPIPPPPDPVTLMPEIREHVARGEFAQALEKAYLLLNGGLIDRDTREELLHIRAEMLFVVNRDNLLENYTEIVDATNQAMNFNQNSPRNAGALLRLGYVNLRVNKIVEAEAHFNMLRRNFPDNENVPLTYYYWGEYHFSRNEMQKAADEFQYILQEFPNSRFARDAALGLARSYYRLGYYEQAFIVADYIERRWGRYYLDYPSFLNMVGDIAFRLNRLDDALRNYWLYMNLQPFGEEADIILTRLGDIYAMQRERAAARELYALSVERFPGRDGALVAMMRLAEGGANDLPSIAGMFSVFDQPHSRQPFEVYRTIIEQHPNSALVPLAKIKLALWYLWDKQYEPSLDILALFLDNYPDHELAPRAREIMLQAFTLVASEGMREQRFGRMREIWEKYAGVRGQVEALSPESRMALAISYRHNARPNEALETLEPLFYGDKIPQYSEMALSLVLSIYLEYEQWQSILDVARRIDLWELAPETQMQLDYAMALAGENLGNSVLAAPLWQRLYDSGKLPPAQMAYATFFLARDAERNRELERAFFLGQEALNRLLELVERSPNAADVGKIQTQLASLMDVAETAGRLREALAFANQYMQYLGANDPERTAVRYRMARIYKKQGDEDNWQKALTEIVAQDPGSVHGQLAASELKAASLARDASQFSATGGI